MKVRARLITDLEEEILFLLSQQEVELPLLTIVERVSQNTNKRVSLGRVHEILMQLEANELIYTTISSSKRNYKITAAGISALQTDWSSYRKSLYGL